MAFTTLHDTEDFGVGVGEPVSPRPYDYNDQKDGGGWGMGCDGKPFSEQLHQLRAESQLEGIE